MVWQEISVRLVLALLFGGIIGFERQWRQGTAGLRTNALVAIGSASFALVGTTFANADSMARVVCQIIPGIGFLGAGVIMREGSNVKGLNTAATLWCSAAVGTFAGLGLAQPAGIATAFIVITNLCLRPLVKLINKNPASFSVEVDVNYAILVECGHLQEAHIRAMLLRNVMGSALSLRKLESTAVADTIDRVLVKASLVSVGRHDTLLEHIVGNLVLESSVHSSKWLVEEKEI